MFTSLKQSHSERISLRQLCFFLMILNSAAVTALCKVLCLPAAAPDGDSIGNLLSWDTGQQSKSSVVILRDKILKITLPAASVYSRHPLGGGNFPPKVPTSPKFFELDLDFCLF
jgi:hypothetical protein